MEIVKHKYENGLRSLSVLTTDTQAVTVMFLVAVGSRFENSQEKGLAHFVEHTIFKGTEKRPNSKQIGMEIESLGGTSNAFTSYDYTGYYIKSPSVNFEKTFDILADMFKNSTFAEKEIERERGVIVEELKMYEDRPTSKVAQEWLRNYFQGNNLGRNIIGTVDSVKGMAREQFFEFMEKHYYAENILVVVAGNVEQKRVEDMVKTHCLDIKPRGERQSSQFDRFEFQATAERKKEIIVKKQVEQTHLVLGGTGISRDDDRRFALQVANTILASGFGSRLFQVIRDELGLAYYVYSRISGFRDTGVYTIGMGVDSNRVDEALQATKEQLAEIVQGKFTQEEFKRAKNYLLGNLVTELETSDDIASFYGMQELLQTEKYSIEEVKQKILGVDLEQVHEIVTELYREDNYYLAKLNGQE